MKTSVSFSYERMGIKTRFEKEAKGNSEMAYFDESLFVCLFVWLVGCLSAVSQAGDLRS